MYLKAHPDDKLLTTIEFSSAKYSPSNDQPDWENENEFRFAGNMFDVIEKKHVGSKIILRCLEDKNETELLKAYEQLEKKQTQEGKNKTATFFQLLATVYVVTEITSIQQPRTNLFTPLSHLHFNLLQRSCEILTPPPRNC
jgi:hypothetical protein